MKRIYVTAVFITVTLVVLAQPALAHAASWSD